MIIHCLTPPFRFPPQVRDRATLYLKQVGDADGPATIAPTLDANLAAMEQQLRSYLAAGDTTEAFDVVSEAGVWLRVWVGAPACRTPPALLQRPPSRRP